MVDARIVAASEAWEKEVERGIDVCCLDVCGDA